MELKQVIELTGATRSTSGWIANCPAHRDSDGEKQLQMMEQIDVNELQKLTGDLEMWFNKL